MEKYKQKQINELKKLIVGYSMEEKQEIAILLMDLAYIYIESEKYLLIKIYYEFEMTNIL